jgi:phosphosulfolactate synthase (CoM biosynthesis protein A)
VDYLNTQIYKCAYCGFDLRLSESTVANEEVLVFQRKLNNAVFYDIIENNFPIIENTQEELFNTIRIFISFFKALLWLNKRHILFEKIDLHEEINLSNYPKGTTFEAMSSADREQLLLVVLKLFTLNINEIQQLFIDLHIVKKSLLSQVLTTSKTINHLAKNLADSSTKRIYAGRSAQIVPKTKDEVEALMDEIRPFI